MAGGDESSRQGSVKRCCWAGQGDKRTVALASIYVFSSDMKLLLFLRIQFQLITKVKIKAVILILSKQPRGLANSLYKLMFWISMNYKNLYFAK